MTKEMKSNDWDELRKIIDDGMETLVILTVCVWIGYKTEREERVESMLQDYIVAENGDGNYEVEVLSISDGKVEYTYNGYGSGFGYVSIGYLENTVRNS